MHPYNFIASPANRLTKKICSIIKLFIIRKSRYTIHYLSTISNATGLLLLNYRLNKLFLSYIYICLPSLKYSLIEAFVRWAITENLLHNYLYLLYNQNKRIYFNLNLYTEANFSHLDAFKDMRFARSPKPTDSHI